MPVLAWFISLTTSRCGVKLSVNWVNAESDSTSTESTWKETPQLSHAEWDSMSTKSTQKTPTFTKILSFRVDSVDMESHLALTHLTRNETPRQLSHCRMLKIWISRRIQEQNKKNQKPYYFAYMCLISAKMRTKKSHASVHLMAL
jgi:hypothetical protein